MSNADLINQVHCSEFFELARQVEDASIDLYLGDLPYGVTACKWDSVIPLEPMWTELKRIMKPRGAIVLTATQPFTSALVMSNPKMFKYEWIWDKVRGVGLMSAKYRPMMQHEDVLIFSTQSPSYYPIMTFQEKRKGGGFSISSDSNPINSPDGKIREYATLYPKSILTFSNADNSNKEHPTQKSVALFEYLIRTYTRPGELVADFTVGSGTTAVASRNLGRDFIVGDFTPEYVKIARRRLAQPFTPQMFADEPTPTDTPKQGALWE